MVATVAGLLYQPALLEAPHAFAYFHGRLREPVPKALNRTADGQLSYAVVTEMPALIARARELRILVATYHTTPTIKSATLRFNRSDCEFRLSAPVVHADNGHLVLTKQASCEFQPRVAHDHGKLILESDAPALAVWLVRPVKGTQRIEDMALGDKNRQLALLGSILNDAPHEPPARHVWHVLAHSWSLSRGDLAPLGWVLAVASILLLFGLLAARQRPAIGYAALFLAFAWAYAVVTPPFQGPDEADHFLDFAKVNDRKDIAETALYLANRGHFERIKFRTSENLTIADTVHPELRTRWARHVAPRSDAIRTPLAPLLWQAEHAVLHNLDAGRMLLGVRLVNALLIAMCLWLGLRVFYGASRDRLATLVLGASIVALPTLPFFAMHTSDYTPLIGIYIGIACLFAGCVISGRIGYPTAAAIGFATGIAFVSSRSASAMPAVALTFVTLGLALTPGQNFVAKLKRGWATLLFVIVAFHLALPLGPASFFAYVERKVGIPLWLLDAGVIVAAALLVAGGIAVRQFWRRLPERISIGKLGRYGATAIVAFLCLGAFLGTRHLIDIEPMRPSLRPSAFSYIGLCLSALLTSLPFGAQSDFFMSGSLWGGFGWLDAMPPDWMVKLLKAPQTLGLAALAILAARGTLSPTAMTWHTAALAAALAWVAALAVAARIVGYNLHGRYLLGVYLVLQTVAALGGYQWLRTWFSGAKLNGDLVPTVAAAAVTAIHAACLTVVITRYF